MPLIFTWGNIYTLSKIFRLGQKKGQAKVSVRRKLKRKQREKDTYLASEGDLLSEGEHAVTSLGMAEDSAAVLSKLQETHPAGSQPPASPFGPAAQFSKEKVLKAALSISRASGGRSFRRASITFTCGLSRPFICTSRPRALHHHPSSECPDAGLSPSRDFKVGCRGKSICVKEKG